MNTITMSDDFSPRFSAGLVQLAARSLIDAYFDAARAENPNGEGDPDAAWSAMMWDIFVLATDDFGGDCKAAKGALNTALMQAFRGFD
jgi:hypothetical protein